MGRVIDCNINDRIERICREIFDGNVTAMAKGTFVSRSTLKSIMGEERSVPGYETLRRIVDQSYLRINPDWLLTGVGEMQLPEQSEGGASPAVMAEPAKTKPHIEDVAAIAGYRGGVAESATWHTVIYKPVIVGLPDYDLTMRVSGDSMYPYLCSGDLIALRELRTPYFKPGEIYVVSTDEDAFVKRVFRSDVEGMAIRCESINPSFPPFDLPGDSVIRMYRVVGMQRVI